MSEHVSFVLIVLTTIVIGSINDAISCRKDWPGLSALPGLLVARVPAVLLLLLLYLHFAHVINLPILQCARGSPYPTLFYIIAAISAEVAVHYFLRRANSGSTLPAYLNAIILRKKVRLADHLENHVDARKFLTDAIQTARELNGRKRSSEMKNLSDPPTRAQIVHIIEVVGLAHLIPIVKR